MYKVYCEDGTQSLEIETLEDAKEWANESNQWFEVVRLEDYDIVYTAEDNPNSKWYYSPEQRERDCELFDQGRNDAKEGFYS
jgi:hypothetical protein